MRRASASLTLFASVLAISVGTLLFAAPANATAEFPGLIVSHLAIKCDGGANPIFDGNGCTICHTSNGGGLGTVTHPFGAGLKKAGLSAFNDNELTKLLDQEKTSKDDFNCDGVPDIDELESCQWPALVTKQNLCDAGTPTGTDGGDVPVENVVYGCSTSPSRESSVVPLSFATGLVGLLVAALVRKRRKAPSS